MPPKKAAEPARWAGVGHDAPRFQSPYGVAAAACGLSLLALKTLVFTFAAAVGALLATLALSFAFAHLLGGGEKRWGGAGFLKIDPMIWG